MKMCEYQGVAAPEKTAHNPQPQAHVKLKNFVFFLMLKVVLY